MYVSGAQKNRLIETVLLSTKNICFGQEKRKINFAYSPFSGGLHIYMQHVVRFSMGKILRVLN